MLLGIGGVRALRAYCRAHRRTRRPRCSTPTRATPASSASSASASSSQDAGPQLRRGARGGPRRHGVHHPHAGAGRHRPLPARAGRAVLRRRQRRSPACRSTAILALGAEDYEGGDPGVFNMAVMGLRLAQRANGVSQLHGEVSRGMFNGLWPGSTRTRCRSARSPTACTPRPGWRREVLDLAAARGRRRARRARRRGWERRRPGPRRRDLGDQARAARAARRRRPRAAARVVAAARRQPTPSSAGSTTSSTPTC